MPDPEKRTVSASEASALVSCNPYLTYWMLYHKFRGNYSPPEESDDPRMNWGKKLQPLITEQVAIERKLEVIPNGSDVYYRRARLGATRDATIIDPQRGPGALEIKCVFDYNVWMTKWSGGKFVPKNYEVQLQTQMFVGDGEEQNPHPYEWGLIAVWVCADLYYFERKPIDDLWRTLDEKSYEFFRRVADGAEPDPFGAPVETPLMNRLFVPVKEKVLDLSNDVAHISTATEVRDYKKFEDDWRFNEAAAGELKAKLMALARDNETVLLPHGINYRIRRSGKGRVIVPYIPEVLKPAPAAPEIPDGAIL